MKAQILLISGLLFAAGCSTGSKSQPVAETDPLDVQSADYTYSEPMPNENPNQYVAPMAAAPVYTPMEPAVSTTPAPVASQTYTIQKGDTAWGLAKRYYGDGKQFHKIFEANPGLSEKNFPAGKTITIPQ
ncbi:MAG TPA: LysM peptidoglycan-binding domain-containing protein [Tepidisphaeraceae bacterium]|nr:LysM peptidoglycan-binding domain-containing protein [Tepidisphaeraceae bacterium]